MNAPAMPQQAIYTTTLFAKIAREGRSSASVVLPRIVELIGPSSVVDVGCGVGAWLSVFPELGVTDLTGLDGKWVEQSRLLIPTDRFVAVDLTTAWPINRRFDLALCLEVGEHLPNSFSAELIKRLTSLAPAVLFSAAIPGQGGNGHINEQWPEFWEKLFSAQGFARLDPVRKMIWQDDRVAWYYQQNLYLFVRKDKVQADPRLQAELRRTQEGELTLIHPKIIRASTSFRTACRNVVRLFWSTLRRRLTGNLSVFSRIGPRLFKSMGPLAPGPSRDRVHC